jgi:hypothetical protein
VAASYGGAFQVDIFFPTSDGWWRQATTVANAAKRDRLGWPLSPAEPVTESVAESGSTIGYWL